MENRSYFARLLLAALALLTGAAVFIFYQTTYKADADLVREFEAREANTLDVALWLVSQKAPYAGVEQFRAYAAEVSRRLGVRVTYVAGGKVLAESGLSASEAEKMEDHSTRPEIVQALAEGFGKATRYSSTLQTRMLYMARRCDGLAGLPPGVLRIAAPYSSVESLLSEARGRFLAVVAAMALCAAGLALFVVRSTQGKLREFSQVVDELGREADAPDGKIRVCPGSEFKPLVDSINTLAKRARRQGRSLHDTQAQYEAVLAKMTDGVAVLDQNGMILAHNRGLGALLGRPEADLSGRHVLEAGLGLDVHEAAREELAKASPSARRLLADLGGGHFADADLAPYSTAKGQRRLILVLHDVSSMKNAERILREFVIDASHQLRTPLTSIQGYAATLIDSPPEDPEQGRAMLGTILKRSKDMGAVVTQLLDRASPQAEALHDAPKTH
ncbi:Sensor protein kinase WalK [Fundidesulfovibrio magnetotacticus]|uniref:histidine kinase n=1 Tax=Fundidesulfovibrio magnetotacticus TaxID=2730080 RepID=A0A6V8LTP4_9BACT|nr:histidine kinase dimerization/phospho-acceptor domain-containing protein [Fundidesulfovibrio magnetotacticus]GFK93176.1 Sensor protein kinase WalK [Fundidesulfovibrio magnetotacticus]